MTSLPLPRPLRSAPTLRRSILIGAFLTWIAVVSLGGWWLSQRTWLAGAAAPPAPTWPAASGPLTADRPVLVVFAHPHCPCSHATLAELAWVLDRCPGPVRVRIFLVVPENAGGGWEQTGLRDAAARLPGAELSTDSGGAVACFGARTSGQVFVYAANGQQLFTGGVTVGRGHRGANLGRTAVLAALQNGQASPPAPVFGCPLFPKSIP